jgi:hypothetical protein
LRLGAGDAYTLQGAPGHDCPWARVFDPGHQQRWEGQTGGEIPSSRANHRVERRWHGSFLRLVIFGLVAPPLHPGVVGLFPGTGCMVPLLFAVAGNRWYLELLSRYRWTTVPEVNCPDTLLTANLNLEKTFISFLHHHGNVDSYPFLDDVLG